MINGAIKNYTSDWYIDFHEFFASDSTVAGIREHRDEMQELMKGLGSIVQGWPAVERFNYDAPRLFLNGNQVSLEARYCIHAKRSGGYGDPLPCHLMYAIQTYLHEHGVDLGHGR